LNFASIILFPRKERKKDHILRAKEDDLVFGFNVQLSWLLYALYSVFSGLKIPWNQNLTGWNQSDFFEEYIAVTHPESYNQQSEMVVMRSKDTQNPEEV